MYYSHEIAVEGHVLHALEFNRAATGIPLVFIHGITASLNMWIHGQTPLIARERRWYSLSLPGHFPATLPPGHQAYELNAEAVARVMGKAIAQLTGGGPVIVAGHSTGGFVAVAVAALTDLAVAGVMCISGFAHGRWTGPLGILQGLAHMGAPGKLMFRAGLGLSALTYGGFKQSIASYAVDRAALFAHPAAEVTFADLYRDFRQLDRDAMHQFFNRMLSIDISTALDRVKAPTLVMAGAEDPIVPPEQARLIASRISGSQLELLPGVGHLPMSERGPEYDRIITEWLQAHFPVPGQA
ncbi:MAG: alpha/beta fold hydrolase [Chloroflexota bacterium]